MFMPLLRARFFLFASALLLPLRGEAHFQMVIPSADIVGVEDPKEISLEVLFAHPFEGVGMDMEKPAQFGVLAAGKKADLLESLGPATLHDHKAWKAPYRLTRPADYVFFVAPQPYWEPAEDRFIIHYAKVVVSAFGAEEGWDQEVGLKTEIIPLTRPYGLYAGNLFSGLVKVKGQARPGAEVEVEYYNKDGAFAAPASPFVAQVVKADSNGVFHYAMPWAGWWGFAALSEDDEKIEKDGEAKPVEIGAVIWVKAYESKKVR